MNATSQPQHQWLRKLLGEWTYEHEAGCAPDKPREKVTGIERVRPLGELWVLCEGAGDMPGGAGKAQMVMTLGFDSAKRRFVGTWVGSMMTYLWVYEGQLDDAQRVLTLNSEGPSFVSEGKTARYQDIIEFLSDDHRTLTSRSLGEDGKWHEFMVAHYRRTK